VEQRFGRDLVFDASSQDDLRHFVADQLVKAVQFHTAILSIATE
jgi:hypothetical protein